MKVKILLIAMVILGSATALLFGKSEASQPQLAAETEAAILASTVQIAMYEHALEPGASEAGGEGLGTVVAYGGERLIITHDHWSHLTPNLKVVEFRDAMGRMLLEVNVRQFQTFIVYQDGGTMILNAPPELNSLAPAAYGSSAKAGDISWVARRDPKAGRGAVEIVPVKVAAFEDDIRPAQLRLNNMSGSPIIPGDSGGGVWFEGQLIANVWATEVIEKDDLLSKILGGEPVEPTGLVFAALQPLGNQIGVDSSTLSSAQVGQSGQVDDGGQGHFSKEGFLQEALLGD